MNEVKDFFHKQVTKTRRKHKDEALLNDVLSKLNIPKKYNSQLKFKFKNPERFKDFLKEIIDLKAYEGFDEAEKDTLGKKIGWLLMNNPIERYSVYTNPPFDIFVRVSCVGITDKNRDELTNKIKLSFAQLCTKKASRVYSTLAAGVMDRHSFFYGVPKEIMGQISKKLLPVDFSPDLLLRKKGRKIIK